MRQRTLHRQREHLERLERFDEKVVSAIGAHGLHCVLDRAITGDDNDLQIRIVLARRAQQIQAVQAGHVQIGHQHRRRFTPPQRLERAPAVEVDLDGAALLFEMRAHHRGQRLIVVNDQDTFSHQTSSCLQAFRQQPHIAYRSEPRPHMYFGLVQQVGRGLAASAPNVSMLC